MPLVVTDAECAASVAEIRAAHPHFYSETVGHERPKRYIRASIAAVQEAPEPTSVVYQKLGFGVQVAVVSEDCADGWTLVMSPYGGVAHALGYVRDDQLTTSGMGRPAETPGGC